MTAAKWAGIVVAVMMNAAYLYMEITSCVYSDLFVVGLTASWGFLGLTANSVITERKQRAAIRAEGSNS